MASTNFSFFSTYVLRTAVFPVSFYTSLLENYSTSALIETVKIPFVTNAIRTASPELMKEFDKYSANPQGYSKEKAVNLELSLLKYIARMSSRATPFGLFAGCSTGTIADETEIRLKEEFTAHTQFDMQFWIALLQKIGHNKDFQKQVIYFPNSSLYQVGDFYRYLEYKYVDKKREHSISSVRKNPFLNTLLEHSKKGAKIDDLAGLIVESESEKEEAVAFIEELIDNQILISQIEATVTGSNEMDRVLKILKNSKGLEREYTIINGIVDKINSLNHPDELNEANAAFIKEKITELNVQFDEKFLLQTDLYVKTATNALNKNVIKKLSKAIDFLGKIQELDVNQNLENFKTAFQKRYESKEMPLALVLDTETGIGYLQNLGMNDSNPILDKFSISKEKVLNRQEFWSKKDYVLEKLVQKCLANRSTTLTLKEEDFNPINPKNRIFPATFSAMIEVINQNGEEIVVLDSLGSLSALKLIGRFCNGSEEINQLAKEIVVKEANIYKDAILAEIAHIPESRTGNILRRPILRAHEIPYLSNSVLPIENQISIDDLMVSVKNNSIFLRSKKLNKEIIPCLSNAHNYSSNALPIYQFLCDLQGQKVHPVFKLDWGILKYHYNDFPRVVYQGVILAKAKWYVYAEELKEIDFSTNFTDWRSKKQIPRFVTIVSGDNTLLLDLENKICYEMMQKTIKSHGKVILEEFLFDEDSIAKDHYSRSYVNQMIISFYNEN